MSGAHTTAVVHPDARLGADVVIGPHAVVHERVALGDGCYRAVAGRDVESWRRELLRAEERWFRGLLDEAAAGRVRKVVVDAGLRTGEAVFEAAGRRARRRDVSAPPGGLAAFLLAEEPASR